VERSGEPRIVVTRRIPEPAIELLREAGDLWVSPHDRPLSTDELYEAIAGADAVVTLLHDRVDRAFLDAAGPQLNVIANVAVGYDNVDVPVATERGVLVTNTPGVLTDATADLTIALILMVTRRLGEGERVVRAGERWSWSMFFLLGRGLAEKTLGVIGLGAIGQATARRARAFGMRIVYAAPRRAPAAVEEELGARHLPLDELLGVADVVSVHCPLRPETRHLIDAERLALMHPDAYLVNTARGPIVDEAALVDALTRKAIAGAALDVFEREPEVDPELLELENVVLIPHLGSATIETRTAMGVLAARNVIAVLNGEPPLTALNPEGLGADEHAVETSEERAWQGRRGEDVAALHQAPRTQPCDAHSGDSTSGHS
jgi:glyoxylate reductase